MIDAIPPAFIYIIGVLAIPFLKGTLKKAWLVAIPIVAFIDLLYIKKGVDFDTTVIKFTATFLDQQLIFGRVDKLSVVFAVIFILASLIGIIYALHIKEDAHHISAFLYVGGALGVVFAGDFLTLFLFWELMAVGSVFLIWFRRKKAAIDAGFRYILVHTAGGLILLAGIMLLYNETGSMAFNAVDPNSNAFYFIIIGFMINAAVPPLHAWLPDAYPQATVPGAVFMSTFTTKTAVYVLIRGFAGTEFLIWMGTIMTLYGVVYAVLENDIRRLLAYHIISQVGYMIAAIGIGTDLALNGGVSHAFAHILYKALLFMGAGAVLHMTARSKLTELGGIYRTMPITMILYMIGGFSISGFPLFSGFVSKSMIVSAAGGDHRAIIMLALTFAAAGTFLSVGLKLPLFTFFGKDSGLRPKEPPKNMLVAMAIAAFFCIAIGVYPAALYNLLPFDVPYHPYTYEHVLWSLQVLLFTGVTFFYMLKIAGPKAMISIDTDWFYRKGIKIFLWFAHKPVRKTNDFIDDADVNVIEKQTMNVAHGAKRFDIEVVDGIVNGVSWANRLIAWFSHQIDIYIVDGLINSAATLVNVNSGFWRKLQTGSVQSYALIMLTGVILILGGLIIFI